MSAFQSGHPRPTDKIGSLFPDQRPISRMTYLLEWDLLTFTRLRRYPGDREQSLGEFITITGEEQEATAVTAEKYLAEQWPKSGPALLNILEQIIDDSSAGSRFRPVRRVLEDRPFMTGWVAEPGFHLEVTGTPERIMQVGEMLVWLAAAFRSSPPGAMVAAIDPIIKEYGPVENPVVFAGALPAFQCRIGFSATPVRSGNASAWYRLFPHTVLVKGFLSRKRPFPVLHTGLEIDLPMMASHLGLARAVEHSGQVFIENPTHTLMTAGSAFMERLSPWIR